MRSSPLVFVAILMLSLALSHPVFAEKNNASPAKTLPEMVVTATAEPTPERKLPVHVQVIDRVEIEQLGVDTLDELIRRKTPGTATTYPGAYTSMRIRGFETYNSPGANVDAKTLVLVDGNPLGSGNLSLIPLGNVERVEVMRGPGSVLYGGSAMGGVINVITKRGKGDLSGSVSAGYGSYNAVQPRASIQGGNKDGSFGASLAGRLTSRETYSDGDGDRYHNTAYHDGAISGTMTISPSEEHTVHILGSYFNAWNVGSPGPTYAPTREANIDDSMKYLSMIYNGQASEWGVDWRLSGWVGQHTYSDNDEPYYEESTFDTSQMGCEGRVSVPTFDFGRFSLGGRYQNIYEKRSGDAVYAPNSRYDIWSAYGEEKLNMGDVTVVGGVRFDQYDLSIDENNLVYAIDTDSKEMNHVSWRAGANWAPLNWLSLRASAGSAFAPPDAYKFVGQYQMGYFNYIGNSDLSPESSTTYEGGFDIDWQGAKLSGSLFHTCYYDAITSTTTTVDGNPYWQTWTNSDGWRLTGLEGFASYTHPFAVSGHTLSLTPYVNWIWYLERKEEDDELARERNSDMVLNLSEYSFTPGLQMGFDSLVNLDLNGQWQGPQKVIDWDTDSASYGLVTNKDPFFVFNAKLTVTPLEGLSAYLSVNNVTDQDYSYVDGYPMPGRTFGAGLEYAF